MGDCVQTCMLEAVLPKHAPVLWTRAKSPKGEKQNIDEFRPRSAPLEGNPILADNAREPSMISRGLSPANPQTVNCVLYSLSPRPFRAGFFFFFFFFFSYKFLVAVGFCNAQIDLNDWTETFCFWNAAALRNNPKSPHIFLTVAFFSWWISSTRSTTKLHLTTTEASQWPRRPAVTVTTAARSCIPSRRAARRTCWNCPPMSQSEHRSLSWPALRLRRWMPARLLCHPKVSVQCLRNCLQHFFWERLLPSCMRMRVCLTLQYHYVLYRGCLRWKALFFGGRRCRVGSEIGRGVQASPRFHVTCTCCFRFCPVSNHQVISVSPWEGIFVGQSGQRWLASAVFFLLLCSTFSQAVSRCCWKCPRICFSSFVLCFSANKQSAVFVV